MLVCSAAPPSVPRPPAKKEKKNNLQFLLRRQKWKAKSGRSKQLMLRLKVPLHLKLTSLFQWGTSAALHVFSLAFRKYFNTAQETKDCRRIGRPLA